MLYLFNTTIVTGLPAEGAAVYEIRRLTVAEAREIYASAAAVRSAIGHDAAAGALSALLEAPVLVNRVPAEQAPGDMALCLKIRGRLPEGKILTLEEMEEIGYDLFLMTRLDADDVEAIASRMFSAYNEAAGGLTWDGKPIPSWAEVGTRVRENWRAAARAR